MNVSMNPQSDRINGTEWSTKSVKWDFIVKTRAMRKVLLGRRFTDTTDNQFFRIYDKNIVHIQKVKSGGKICLQVWNNI